MFDRVKLKYRKLFGNSKFFILKKKKGIVQRIDFIRCLDAIVLRLS